MTADAVLSAFVVEDEPLARQRLRGLIRDVPWLTHVGDASTVPAAISGIDRLRPDLVFLDVRLSRGTGLDVLAGLFHRPGLIFTTAYDRFAVTAFELGAIDYLSKPADADDVVAALTRTGADPIAPPENPMSADRVRWEHIQRVYEMCDRNVSETARRLNMHRRTLQRILAKRAPR